MNKNERLHKLKDASYAILCSLAESTVSAINTFVSRKDLWEAVFEPFANEMRAERERLHEIAIQNQYLRELKRARLLREKTTANGLVYALTRKGLESILREKINREDKLLENRYCVITFDIPESQRHVRKMLRQLLREWKFFQVHKSVWATDKDVAGHLLALIKIAKVEKWVNIFLAQPLLINMDRNNSLSIR